MAAPILTFACPRCGELLHLPFTHAANMRDIRTDQIVSVNLDVEIDPVRAHRCRDLLDALTGQPPAIETKREDA